MMYLYKTGIEDGNIRYKEFYSNKNKFDWNDCPRYEREGITYSALYDQIIKELKKLGFMPLECQASYSASHTKNLCEKPSKWDKLENRLLKESIPVGIRQEAIKISK